MGMTLAAIRFQSGNPADGVTIAILLLIAVAIGAAIGYVVAKGAFGRSSQSLKAETTQLRLEKDQAQTARAQAQNDRERALGESQARQQEYALLETQLRSAQRQVTQATAAWKTCEEQVQEMEKATEAFRGQVEELRLKLVDTERQASERLLLIDRLNNQLKDTSDRYNEVERLAMDRQAALTSSNTQLSRMRATMAETDFSITEVQMMLQALILRVDSLRDRVTNLDTTPYAPLPAMPTPISLPASGGTSASLVEHAPGVLQPKLSAPADTGGEQAPGESEATPAEDHRKPTLAPPPVLVPPAPATPVGGPTEPPPPAPEPATAHADANIEDQLEQMTRRLDELHAALSRVSGTAPNGSASAAASAVGASPSASASSSNSGGDDLSHLQDIRGIGLVYAMRLNRAGVRSLDDLAEAAPDKLESIINAPKWRRPDYEDWIKQARQLKAQAAGSPAPQA